MDKQTLYLYLRVSTDNQNIIRQKEKGLQFFEQKKSEGVFKDCHIVVDEGKSRFHGMDKRQNLMELFDKVY